MTNEAPKDGDTANRRNKKNKRFNEGLADDGDIYETIERKPDHPSKSDQSFIENSLKGHFFFAMLTSEELSFVSGRMFLCRASKGNYVFNQDDPASCFFIIKEGEIAVEIDGNEKKRVAKGGNFGELALLYNAPRSASIKTLTDCEFWAIDRSTFKSVVSEVTTKQFKENREFLEKVPFFDSMTEKQKESIAGALVPQVFRKGENIISEGDAASSYYIIYSGTAECVKGGKVLRELKKHESFGEQALYQSGHRTLTVRAGDECRCLALSRGDLQEILGNEIQKVIQGNWSRWAIEKDPVFNQLTSLQTEKWIMNAEVVKKEAHDVILPKDSSLTSVIIVLNGELRFGNTSFAKGTVFGGDYLYPKENLGRM